MVYSVEPETNSREITWVSIFKFYDSDFHLTSESIMVFKVY